MKSGKILFHFLSLQLYNPIYCDFARCVAGIYRSNFSFNPHRLGTQPELICRRLLEKNSFIQENFISTSVSAFSESNLLFSIKRK